MIATAVGVLESLVGIFALHNDPFLGRTVYLVVLNWIGAAYGVLGYVLARRVGSFQERFWPRVLVADLVTFVPQALTVWASTWLVGGKLGPETLWLFLAYTFVLSGASIAAFIAPILDRAMAPPTGQRLTAPSSFAERLPFALRSAELWAVASEDHCLRAITSRGQAVIRMRLADAIKELYAIEGTRCHRSWWVARASISDVRREDGRLRALVLPDGTEVPVSRSGAAKLVGWL